MICIGEWGAWTHAVLPVDDSLGVPDDENLTGLCDLIGSLLRPPRCHDDEKAMIVLRRPGSPEISEADAHIFAQVRQAVARRETAPWAFHVAGPAGTREVTEHEARQDPAQTPSGVPGSAEELPEDGGSPGRDVFVGEELRAYPEGRLGGIHLDNTGEETKYRRRGSGPECCEHCAEIPPPASGRSLGAETEPGTTRDNPEYLPLTDEVISAHLAKGPGRLRACIIILPWHLIGAPVSTPPMYPP